MQFFQTVVTDTIPHRYLRGKKSEEKIKEKQKAETGRNRKKQKQEAGHEEDLRK